MSAIKMALIMLTVCILLHTRFTTATFYSEISPTAAIWNDTSTTLRLIHKYYHQCSIKDICNFVVKDVRRQTYSIHSSEDELPSSREWYRIWRKMPDIVMSENTKHHNEVKLGNVANTCKVAKPPNGKQYI